MNDASSALTAAFIQDFDSIVLLIAAFVISFGLCLIFIRLGRSGVLLDAPNARSLHTVPTTRAGGIAIAIAMLPTLVIFLPQAGTQLHAIIAGWLLVFAVSLVDDFRNVPAAARLSAHVVAATGVLLFSMHSGNGVSDSGWFFGFGLFWIVWGTNLFNFMDGMDGLAGMMALIGGATLSVAFVLAGAGVPALILGTAGAAVAGFLWFNRPPAKIFMGDAGSAPLGFLLSAIAVDGVRENLIPPWLPLLVFLPFISDATLTLLRRAWQRKRIWQAHREHAYQALVLAGIPVRKVLLAWSLVMACCGLAALVAVHLGKGGLELLLLAILLFVLGYWVIIRKASS